MYAFEWYILFHNQAAKIFASISLELAAAASAGPKAGELPYPFKKESVPCAKSLQNLFRKLMGAYSAVYLNHVEFKMKHKLPTPPASGTPADPDALSADQVRVQWAEEEDRLRDELGFSDEILLLLDDISSGINNLCIFLMSSINIFLGFSKIGYN